MSDSKFTPGPWNLHPYYSEDLTVRHFEATEEHGAFETLRFRISQGEKLLGDFEYQKSYGNTGWPKVGDMDEARANVALVLKAPDLYSLVAKLAEFCEPFKALLPREIQELATEARAIVTAIDTAEVFNKPDEVDVCIAGNPAINGKCGDPECVCA